jgi:hypothetical protein
MRTILLFIIAIACIVMCSHSRAAEESIQVDTSPQAIEAAYQAVRAGDAVPQVSLKETADALLIKLINVATATGEFIADQVPIVIKELLRYYIALHLFKALLCIPFFYFGYWIFTRITQFCSDKNGKYDPYHRGSDYAGIRWLALIPHTIGIAILVTHIPPLLKITLAPRVWLIEYAASLVK